MIYNFFKKIIGLALNVYFRKVHIKGLENIPIEGPFLIVSNHPSSFLDPLSIGVLINHKISFLAKATMFNNKIIGAILKQFNMVPIYRAQDNPKNLSKNEETFKACYQKLSDKGVIMIFPEGTSESERKLRKIKTGAARIALGTAKENDYDLNVKILPVGLNYTKSSRFKSELFIQFGKPLESDHYSDEYRKDEILTAKKLTENIEKSIKNLIIDIDKDEYEVLVKRVESLYKTQLLKITPDNDNDIFANVEASQKIYSAIKHFQKEDPTFFYATKTKIDEYFLNLKAMNISDKSIEKGSKNDNILGYFVKSIFILIIGFPIWLFGYTNSYIPYKTPRFIALKITDSEAFYGALLMSLGTFSFIIFYSLIIVLVWEVTKNPAFTICYAITLPLSSLFTIFYARIARRLYYNWQFASKFFSKQKVLIKLMSDRNDIIQELEIISERFKSRP